MKSLSLVLLLVVASRVPAQTTVSLSAGEVASARMRPVDASRLTRRIMGPDSAQLAQVRVGPDSAQRIAMADFDWRGRVLSVEFDSADSRVFWDVKIVPDSAKETLVRYRVDAGSGGIMDIHEFAGIRLRRRGGH